MIIPYLNTPCRPSNCPHLWFRVSSQSMCTYKHP